MKIKKSLLIVALSLMVTSGLIAKEQTKKDAVPGVAPQPASFFYTGKPYDADLGTYAFNFRNYDSSTARWTTTDPSGFPDGANNWIYRPVPTSQVDPTGLITVNGDTSADGSYYSSTFPGFFNYASYFGDSNATAGATTATLNMSAYIEGFTTFSSIHTMSRTPSISITIDPNGNLLYTPNDSFGGADGVIGEGLSYTVDGAGTKALTFHVWGNWALSATAVSGLGGSLTGGSVSWTAATRSDGPVALGTFQFIE